VNWRVERRHRGAVWEWLADTREQAFAGFCYCEQHYKTGTLHLIDPRDAVVLWSKASDRAALFMNAAKKRKAA
jgi:hypothetical protein